MVCKPSGAASSIGPPAAASKKRDGHEGVGEGRGPDAQTVSAEKHGIGEESRVYVNSLCYTDFQHERTDCIDTFSFYRGRAPLPHFSGKPTEPSG